jgi:DNA topoisomerase-1
LYEGIEVGDEGSVGLITYMRTDSFRVAAPAVEECRGVVKDTLGADYLHPKPRYYKSRKGAQGAHEAVRPTSAARTPEQLEQFLTADQHRLYTLIWERFVASQMSDAVYDETNVSISAADGLFKAKGRVCLFDGHTRVYSRREKDVQDLPELKKGQSLDLLELEPSQHFTKPPPRYTEATLVRTLEREGIGRPSTYAAIISTIQDRGYVKQVKRAFHATDLGILVTDLLVASFPQIMDVKFTSGMEEKLDQVEEEDRDWVAVLDEFYKVFHPKLDKAREEMESAGGKEVEGETCPECGKPLVERWSKYGKFFGCSGFPSCRYTRPAEEEGAGEQGGEGEEGGPEQKVEVECDKCGKPMVVRTGRRGKFLGCSGYPECKNTRPIGKDGKPLPPPEPTDEVCEECGKPMVIRSGRRGRFLACTGYPKCRNTRPLPKGDGDDDTGGKTEKGRSAGRDKKKSRKPAAKAESTDEVCEKCGKPMVIRSGRNGRFLGCSGYPKCRNTKALPTDVPCPRDGCDGTLVYRRGKGRGSKGSYGCTRYPDCDYTTNELPDGGSKD